jgi:hypothetical protein
MKLDPDLMREILLHIETAQDTNSWQYEIDSEDDYPRYYAATKLLEAGFLDGAVYGGVGEDEVIEITALTFSGHQFLETLRAPEAWSYAKAGAAKLKNFGIDVLVALGRAYAEQKLKEVLGITAT